jgi:hypothetical protein
MQLVKLLGVKIGLRCRWLGDFCGSKILVLEGMLPHGARMLVLPALEVFQKY